MKTSARTARFALYALLGVLFAMLVLGLGAAAPAQAAGIVSFDLTTTIASPVDPYIPTDPYNPADPYRLLGYFVIRAHITVPSDPYQPSMLATVYLDASHITAVNLNTGVTYRGLGGSSYAYSFNNLNPTFLFVPGFNLLPPNPIQPTDPYRSIHTTIPFSVILNVVNVSTSDGLGSTLDASYAF